MNQGSCSLVRAAHGALMDAGHARLSTTAIYAAACGPEEREFAARYWRAMDSGDS
jgi:hypothetical protein